MYSRTASQAAANTRCRCAERGTPDLFTPDHAGTASSEPPLTPVLAQLSALKASLESSYRLANLKSTVYDTLATSPYRTQMVAAIDAVVSRAPLVPGDSPSGTHSGPCSCSVL